MEVMESFFLYVLFYLFFHLSLRIERKCNKCNTTYFLCAILEIVRSIFRNFIAVIVLIGVVFAVTNYSGLIQQETGIKMFGSDKGKGIAGQVLGDATSQVNNVKNQAMHVNVSDILNYLSRFKRVPQDINSAKDFIGQQVSSISGQKKERAK